MGKQLNLMIWDISIPGLQLIGILAEIALLWVYVRQNTRFQPEVFPIELKEKK